jgi:pimeloyl-ACP methyl ester carboxylesterase
VIALMDMEGLLDVTLVGHSYAGIVTQGVADRVPSRLASLVYLDAYVVQPGKSLVDYVPADRREGFVKSGEAEGFKPFPAAHFGVTDPNDIAWVGSRLVNQPFRTFTQPLTLSNPPPKVPHTYIACTQPAMGPFTPIAAALRNIPSWKVVELKTGHDAMVTQPRALANLLLQG